MKILFDTSALLPGFRYPDLREKALGHVIWAGHTPVVTDYILDELRENIHKRYSDAQKAVALDLLLQIMSMNVLEVKLWDEYASHLEEAFKWVPEKDAPVLLPSCCRIFIIWSSAMRRTFSTISNWKARPGGSR